MACAGTTVAFIGCGNMGSALLHGLLQAYHEEATASRPFNISKIITCTRSEKSAAALRHEFEHFSSLVEVRSAQNHDVMKEADVIVLGFKPFMAKEILEENGVRRSVSGKLVISLLAGLSVADVHAHISQSDKDVEMPAFWASKAVPTLASRYQQSMTILEQPPADFPSRHLQFLEWVFGLVGQTKLLDSSLVDVGSVLVTACVATLTVPIDGILDGSVVEGFRRQDALDLVGQSIIGLGALLSNGAQPASIREQVSSPKGCTIQTLVAVERRGVRAHFTDALLNGTAHLRALQRR